MRLSGQAKAGYYPIPPEAMAHVLSYIEPPADPSTVTIIDPCAGAGDAIKQIADAWGVPYRNVWGAELDEVRGAQATAKLPESTILSPADGTSVASSFNVFSFAWINPPYDNELGGGARTEQIFFEATCRAVRPGGVVAFALPEHQLEANIYIRESIIAKLDDPILIRYPQKVKKFNECVVIGRVRASRRDMTRSPKWGALVAIEPRFGNVRVRTAEGTEPRFTIEPGRPPTRFEKTGYTTLELAVAMASSPAKKMFAPPAPRAMPRPALQLGVGQRALVLAGGFLNRVLVKDGMRILPKASPFKDQFVKSQDAEEVYGKDGSPQEKVTTVYSERICLRVRVLDTNGDIHDLR